MIFEISLEHVRMYAYHGVYEEERKIGGEFEINLTVVCDRVECDDMIGTTVSYAALYADVQEVMSLPCDLIETVALRIAELVQARNAMVRSGWVSVTKLAPPIPGMKGQATVKYSWNQDTPTNYD